MIWTIAQSVWDLDSPGCVIVKHAAPCGAAIGNSAEDAFTKALGCDPVSAFGGIVSFYVKWTRNALWP